MTTFDVCGDIPTGTALLEASAGTGKTFTIAALATRIVAEGRADLSELMLVTFGRAATAELRERVREQLVSAYRRLTDPGSSAAGDDPIAHLLAQGAPDEVRRRRHRLRRALSAFDAATIATTHGFCEQMLAGLGTAGDKDPGDTLVERVDDLVDEVLTDWWVARFSGRGAVEPPFAYGACARQIAQAAVADRHARLVPDDAPEGTPAALRFVLADAVRDEVRRRKRDRHLYDYDDLLTRLRDALRHPVSGPVACQRLRNRYRYVLVDEFQDTDPVQWDILRTAFDGHTTLILIGDPKQAIYAFRGADVYAYLDAAAVAQTRLDLGRNWRSDRALLDALHALYGDLALGDPRIVARHVDAQHDRRRLEHAPAGAPLRVRLVPRASLPVTRKGGLPPVAAARAFVARDLAADVVRLLSSPATLDVDPDTGPRRVLARDIAVLVGTHRQAVAVHEALRAAGVPAVLTGMRSVFGSAAAREWLTFLRALEQPHRPGPVRAAALTAFVGWTALRLATAPDVDIDDLGRRLREWRDLLAERGVAALFEVVAGGQRLPERVLGGVRGERHLTDLRHVAQALHTVMQDEGLGSTALVEWLQKRVEDAEREVTEERSRRLETDAEAVQVTTIHTSKGLEFPIVYVPFGWDEFAQSGETMQLHSPDGERLLFVGGADAPGHAAARRQAVAEDNGENLRLLYVALTRAQCQVVTWWAGTANTKTAPLHRLLFGSRTPGAQPPVDVPVPLDVDARRVLRAWADAAGGCVGVEEAAEPPAVTLAPTGADVTDLDVAMFGRRLDFSWRRTSYTALTAAAHDTAAGVASEPEGAERADEPAGGAGGDEPDVPLPTAPPGQDSLRAVTSPLADFPGGTTFGNVVHGVFEEVDTSAPDLPAALSEAVRGQLARRLLTLDAASLTAALETVMRTPLGPLAEGRTLAGVAASDRLAELEFELPLVGGDQPSGGRLTVGAVATLLRRHLPAEDPLASYPDLLDSPMLRGEVLRGYLTGSIDTVLRLGDPVRYLVVDYKTNWLGSGDEPLTAWHYRPAALATAMLHAHYPLQALLYLVALHRYLRWRQPSYEPATHLGGVLYLFVRGMCGPDTPVVDGVPTGVFSWRPPAALVTDLSDLLDRGAA